METGREHEEVTEQGWLADRVGGDDVREITVSMRESTT